MKGLARLGRTHGVFLPAFVDLEAFSLGFRAYVQLEAGFCSKVALLLRSGRDMSREATERAVVQIHQLAAVEEPTVQ